MTDTGTISGYFRSDHDRLDALLQLFQTLKRQNFAKAKEAVHAIQIGP